MAGIVSTPVFVKDGQYLTFAAEAAITIGQVVELTSSETVQAGTVADGTNVILGVAVAGRRFSRTQTDDSIAAGELVNVCTRGVINVLAGTSAILIGSVIEAGAAGIVELSGTNGSSIPQDIIGMALEANAGAAVTIKILLFRG